MDLKFHRFAAGIFRRAASNEVPAPRLARVARTVPPPQDRVQKAAPVEPLTRPLYDPSVYHSRMETLPTFMSAYLDEAAAEDVAQSVENRGTTPS